MTPHDRRELWLGVALCVARDGLPAPEGLSIETGEGVYLTFDDASSAAQWAAALQLGNAEIIDNPGRRLIHSWWGKRGAVVWSVIAYVSRDRPTAAAESLADLLVDVIVTVPPDR